ncbi:hypothetical protein J1N35_041292 [Gossypium stocksii]|uniref:Uncharacterized protein n=1 Tax=Gossypium stocksii TaxID=47602 RepID=A0A9D3UFQ1_9ROSI|nr:hypothetical protein J1N35_041292 [Gossypium stocksii]
MCQESHKLGAAAISLIWSYVRSTTDAMSQTWSYTGARLYMPMPCPIHGLTLIRIKADAMSQTWSYTSSHHIANAMSLTWSYTSAHVEPMQCPKHGLTLTLSY